MRPSDLHALLSRVAAGELDVEAASRQLASLPFEDLGDATVDHHREIRTGFPEIVFGAGKSVDQMIRIVTAIAARGQPALVTRVEASTAAAVRDGLSVEVRGLVHIDALPRLLFVGEMPAPRGRGRIAVVSAGTSDAPVFEEAARVAELLGNEVLRVQDVGVAGLHRLLARRAEIEAAEVVIAVAGMEGALPSVLAGLITRPVIAVPTSVGLGANFGGLAALLAMLNSCASGVTVVNIDNGFGAAYAASLINAPRSAA